MKSTYVKIAVFVLMVGLLTACGAQAANTPASAPTEEAATVTQPPTDAPAPTDTAAPTGAPATEAATTEPAAATQPAVEGSTVSFSNEVLPIIQSRCVNCHGGDRTEEGLNLTSHAAILAGSENGSVIVPGDAVNSLLIELVASQEMPKRGPKLTPPQVQIITDWVNEGALDN